ncbi:Ger(x)C family spore germination protein [Cohnella faecalis]|uniref:Ger(X)C family spore germination protein n=1 Tax=Cohnella faecalis TaxID=2315694 RepID=A0A398CRT1_9BACL|nr:Ger(x)C family spore germination protein [Cohnella faecalis]
MIRKVSCVLLAIALASILNGCWNRREMNELAIAVGMGIDKIGEQYRVSVQVVVPGEVTSQKTAGRSPVTLYKTESATVFEASRKLTTISPRKIYFSHLRLFVVGESLAQEGLGEILEFISRDHEFRNDFYVVIARETSAESTLKITTSLENIPVTKMFASLETSEKNWSPTMTVNTDELIASLVSDGKQPVLPGLRVIGDQEIGGSKTNTERIDSPGNLQLSGLGVFKNDKLIGWLSEEDSRGYNYILNNVRNSVGHIGCPNGGKVTLEITRAHSSVKGTMIGERPRIEIGVRIEGSVGEVECAGLDLTKSATLFDLEKRAEHKVTEIMESVVEKAQKTYESDIFGFGEAIHRTDPQAWKTLKEHWDDRHFVHLPVTINVDFKIRRVGTVGDSFLNKLKE